MSEEMRVADEDARSSALEIEVSHDFESLAPLQPEWDALVERTGGDIFLTFDWCRAWWRFYGAKRSLHVFVARSGGALVGIMPIAVQRMWLGPVPLRVARMVGSDSTLSICTPPLLPDHATGILERVFRLLTEGLECDVISIGPLSGATDARAQVGAAAAACSDLVEDRSAPSGLVHTLFELPETFDAYLAGLPKKVRGTYRRDRKKLAALGDLRVETVIEAEAAGPAFETFLKAHGEQWRRVGNGGHFHDWPDSEAFHRELLTTQGRLGRLRLTRLFVGDEVAVSHYGYTFGQRYVWFMPGRKSGPDWDPFGLGRLGLVSDFEARIAEGVRFVEGGRGHYEYKVRLGAQEQPLDTSLLISRRTGAAARMSAFGAISRLINLLYYRGWYIRGAKRLGIVPGPLRRAWIRTQL